MTSNFIFCVRLNRLLNNLINLWILWNKTYENLMNFCWIIGKILIFSWQNRQKSVFMDLKFKIYLFFRHGLCGNSLKCPMRLRQTYLWFCHNFVIYSKFNNELIIRLTCICSVNETKGFINHKCVFKFVRLDV